MSDHDTGIAFADDVTVKTEACGTSEGLVSSVTPADWLQGTVVQLDALRDLGANWDSYDADPIEEKSVSMATELVTKLAYVQGVEAPFVTATPDGRAAFEWNNDDRSLDIEVYPTGLFAFVYTNRHDNAKNEERRTRSVETIANLLTAP